MGLGNGIPLGIRTSYIRIGNNFDCVEGVTRFVLMWNSFMCYMTHVLHDMCYMPHSRWRFSFMRNMTLSHVKYCICINICKYVYIYIYVQTCPSCKGTLRLNSAATVVSGCSASGCDVYGCQFKHVHEYVHVYVYVHVCMYVCMHACMYVRVYVHTCIYVYMYDLLEMTICIHLYVYR